MKVNNHVRVARLVSGCAWDLSKKQIRTNFNLVSCLNDLNLQPHQHLSPWPEILRLALLSASPALSSEQTTRMNTITGSLQESNMRAFSAFSTFPTTGRMFIQASLVWLDLEMQVVSFAPLSNIGFSQNIIVPKKNLRCTGFGKKTKVTRTSS